MKLLEPITIQGMTLRNRVVMSPMGLGFGLRGARARAFYLERASGGVSAILLGAITVDFLAREEAWGGREGLENFLKGLRQLPEAVHQAGVKIGPQLWHTNRYPGYLAARREGERVGPSPCIGKSEWWEEDGEIRELGEMEIQDIVAQYGKAAAAAQAAGFDFVEIHGGHAYLLSQFFSPLFNRRRDKYGGDLKGRMRLGLECVTAVRKAVGKDYPVFFRLGAWEDTPGGVTLGDSRQFAQALEAAGVNCIDVSVACGIPNPSTPEGASPVSPLKKAPMGTFAWVAAEIKKAVKVPVIAVGRMNSHKVAEEVLQQGKADLIAMGRQLLADPFWLKKVAEGRTKEIIACDSCNKECFDFLRGKNTGCHLNPRLGREAEVPLTTV